MGADGGQPAWAALAPQPLVTIVTPSLNQRQFIDATIRSVLAQDYPAIEYIVMDGGSSDGTLDILRRYDGRLTWVSAPDRGQADAINRGWRRGGGEILAWLNSDDVYLPGAVIAAVAGLRAHPAARQRDRGHLLGHRQLELDSRAQRQLAAIRRAQHRAPGRPGAHLVVRRQRLARHREAPRALPGGAHLDTTLGV